MINSSNKQLSVWNWQLLVLTVSCQLELANVSLWLKKMKLNKRKFVDNREHHTILRFFVIKKTLKIHQIKFYIVLIIALSDNTCEKLHNKSVSRIYNCVFFHIHLESSGNVTWFLRNKPQFIFKFQITIFYRSVTLVMSTILLELATGRPELSCCSYKTTSSKYFGYDH